MAQELKMLDRFVDRISKLPESAFHSKTSMPNELLLEQDGSLTVHYTPFDYVNPDARVIIVGVTPGIQQANNACIALRTALRRGESLEAAARIAKHSGAFSGPMRNNLVAMLDAIGLAGWLGIESTASLWSAHADLAHTTSMLRYPVLVRGRNYNGSPAIERSAMLEHWFRETFGTEISRVPNAVLVPLGPKVEAQLQRLIDEGTVNRSRVLLGLPHPSGANAERIAYFLGRKERAHLSSKTDPDRLDRARSELSASVQAFGGLSV